MAVNLQPCPACTRHINVQERECPFCHAATPETFAAATRPRFAAPLSRAAVLFASAAAITGMAACSSSTANPVEEDGGKDAATIDTGMPVAAYGPAVIDSGMVDAGQQDTGNPAVLYGPAVIDSGMTDAGDAD